MDVGYSMSVVPSPFYVDSQLVHQFLPLAYVGRNVEDERHATHVYKAAMGGESVAVKLAPPSSINSEVSHLALAMRRHYRTARSFFVH